MRCFYGSLSQQGLVKRFVITTLWLVAVATACRIANTDTVIVTVTQTPSSTSLPTLTLTSSADPSKTEDVINELKTTTLPTPLQVTLASPTPAIVTTITTTQTVSDFAFGFDLGVGYFGITPVTYSSLEEAEESARNWRGHYPHYAGEPLHDGTAVGPGDALLLSFANYANTVAYWTDKEIGQLWISDMELEMPRLIYADEAQVYATNDDSLYAWDGKGDLIWTPDDLHVIFDPKDKTLPNLIYHLQSNAAEPWPWDCDRVAVSPQTKRLATWCAALDGSPNFAIIEWGGEIWISPSPPVQEIVRRRGERAIAWESNWTWSSDGQQIAYFDPLDTEGRLFVADATGVQKALFPGAAWWLNLETSHLAIPQNILQWSQDGRWLLVYANDLISDSCPDIEIMFDLTEGELSDVPCWHLLDTQDYRMHWSWRDFMMSADVPSEFARFWRDFEASISTRGNYLLFTMFIDDNSMWGGIVRFGEGDILVVGPTPASTMRWLNE